MAVKVRFWKERSAGRIIVGTDLHGKLDVKLEGTGLDHHHAVLVGFTDFSVSDNKFHQINLSHQHGRFRLKVDEVVTSNIAPDLKTFSQLTFLHEPLEFCGKNSRPGNC